MTIHILTRISKLTLKMWLWKPVLSPTSVLWKNAILPFGVHGYFHLKLIEFDFIDVTSKFSMGELTVKIVSGKILQFYIYISINLLRPKWEKSVIEIECSVIVYNTLSKVNYKYLFPYRVGIVYNSKTGAGYQN